MISSDQLARLAELYDRYQNSLLPFSPDRAKAGHEFKKLLGALYAAHAADLPFDAFRRATIAECREYLRKNKAP